MPTPINLSIYFLLLACGPLSCGISSALKSSMRIVGQEKETGGEKAHPSPSLEREKFLQSDGSKDIASEPAQVGGAFLSCLIVPPQSLEERLRQFNMACDFNPKDPPAAASKLSFVFAQGASPETATPLALSSSETPGVTPEGKGRYIFHFSREAVRGPYLFAEARDSSKNPPAKYQAVLDVREMYTLVGGSGAIVGPLAPWPIGLSDTFCSPAPGPEGPTKLNVAHAWMFQVQSDTAVIDLQIKGLCGVSALFSGQNKVYIKGSNEDDPIMASLSLERDVKDPMITSLLLPRGSYQVVAHAYRNVQTIGVFDNVLIGRMTLEVVSGEIDMGPRSVIESLSSDASQD